MKVGMACLAAVALLGGAACGGGPPAGEAARGPHAVLARAGPEPARAAGVPPGARWLPFVPDLTMLITLPDPRLEPGGIWCYCRRAPDDRDRIECKFYSRLGGPPDFSGEYFADPASPEMLEDLQANLLRVDGYVVVLRLGKLSPRRVRLGENDAVLFGATR
jgi:hypothetical protein